VYIVNRRTVVDQATDEAKRLLGLVYQSGQRDGLPWATQRAFAALGLTGEPALSDESEPHVAALRDALIALSGDDTAPPLAVSTLRGELADNGEWKVNPARPAIIIGTIDMIGSKLLFSGYGDGRYGRAHHAGLIGQDALIVHDEAHLSPAFSKLLRAVEQEQEREFKRNGRPTSITRPIRVMELSATTRHDGDAPRPGSSGAAGSFAIEDEDAGDSVVQQRLMAKKQLSLVEVHAGDKNGLVGAMVEAALQHADKGCRVLVYVQKPDVAADVRQAIGKGIMEKAEQSGIRQAAHGVKQRVGLLTGTIRGYERDILAEGELFKAFRSDPNRPLQLEHTLYLVSTSAGEVGADWDADHLVCDLTTLDNMAQRFGRVNRLGGEGRSAEITLIVEKPTNGAEDKAAKKPRTPSPLDAAIAKTGEILRSIARNGGEVSPAALAKVFDGLSVEDKRAAFSPTPTILTASDILFDAWSLTSIAGELPGRPEVAPYLHGVAEWEPPETYVAWRAELAELARADVSNDDLEEVFDAFPIRATERLRDRTDRVFDELREIAARVNRDHARADADAEAPRPRSDRDPRVVLITQNKVQWVRLSELAPVDRSQNAAAISRLAYAIVVLPVEAGGLGEDGTLDGSALPPGDPTALDVAEATATGQRIRQRVCVNADNTKAPLTAGGSNGALPCKLRIALADDEAAEDDEGGSRKVAIEYCVERSESGEPGTVVALRDHTTAVEAAAKRIGQALCLPALVCEALALAARWHDAGKTRAVWQRYARNGNPAAPVAKSPRYLHPKALGGYRHELGSLLDAARPAGAAGLPMDEASDVTEVANHPERDLILHLIATHHGWGRPHFESMAFDRERLTTENETVAVEVMQRFGRLQQRFGRWGLAWLESLLRCADIAASKQAVASSNAPASSGDPVPEAVGT
jgi:CRISPR-associated endonuclease/helicase Cas3